MKRGENTVVDAERVLVGERVRTLRTTLHISVRNLASQAGFSPSFISQVENGVVSPSIASLERIASVLGVTLAGFFTGRKQGAVAVSRADGRQETENSSWSKARVELLTSNAPAPRLEAVMITVLPGGRSGSQPTGHRGEEFALVFDGEVSLTLGKEAHILSRGDSLSFSSEDPHLWENPGTEDARIVIVSPRFTH